jgi:Family of unknown function (DUF6765)
MQKDFHYYIVYALAREAGYENNDAYSIAYSSQYVDDNTDREYTVTDSYSDFYVGFPDEIGKSGNLYFPIITQSVDITALKLSTQRYVFAPFHFVPGDNNVDIKGLNNPLCTTRGCQNAVSLVQDAKKSGDPFRLGIALHTYADTWSHERFSAFHEDWNRVFKTGILKNLPPNVGHGEVYNQPDEISHSWIDERFGKSEIDNKERALRASEEIFQFIKKGKRQWEDVKPDFEKLINAKDLDERIKLVREKYPDIERYDEDKWFNEALSFSRDSSEVPEYDPIRGVPKPARVRFTDVSVKDINSRWFRFQEAAKKQLSMVLSMTHLF